MQVESIGWAFDVLQADALDDSYPRIEALFVGRTPAVAYDAQNQPKFNRTIERRLKALERDLRHKHQADLSTLGSADLAQNALIIQRLVTDYSNQLRAQILVPAQLDLESLTLAGEWPLFWNEQAPLVRQKAQSQTPMPLNPTPQTSQPTTPQPADHHHPDTPNGGATCTPV